MVDNGCKLFVLSCVFLAVVSQTTQQSSSSCACPNNVYDADMPTAEIKSPRYPQNYCNAMNCTWTIEGGADNTAIRLHIEDLQTEFQHDYIEVSQTEGEHTVLLDRLSGTSSQAHLSTLPDFVSAPGNGFSVRFRTDGSVIKRGFVARFTRFNVTQENCACKQLFYQASATTSAIVSPNFPTTHYCPNIKCYYRIESPESVELRFTSIDTTPGQDVIRVYESESKRTRVTPNKLLTTLSGPTLTAAAAGGADTTVITRGHGLLVVFEVKSTINHLGWTANYVQQKSPCNCGQLRRQALLTKAYLTSPGFPDNYCDGLTCDYEIHANSPSDVIQLSIISFRTESRSDKLIIKDASGGQERTLITATGVIRPPEYFTSNGPSMKLSFITDVSVTQPGFNISYQILRRDAACRCPTPQPKEYSSSSAVVEFFPGNGTNCGNLNCIFVLHPPSGQHELTLNISYFTPTEDEWLQLKLGWQPGNAPSGGVRSVTLVRTQSTTMRQFTHSDTAATLYYHSQHNRTTRRAGVGFRVSYSWNEKCKCGPSSLTASRQRQTLTSPDHPARYCNHLRCSWTITAPVGERVVFLISRFRTEARQDYLRLFDGLNNMSRRINQFHGTSYGFPEQRSTGRFMTIRFDTDLSVVYDGWAATYWSEPTTAPTGGPPPPTQRTQRPPRTNAPDDTSNESGGGGSAWGTIILLLILAAVVCGVAYTYYLHRNGRLPFALPFVRLPEVGAGFSPNFPASAMDRRSNDEYRSSRIALMTDD